MNIGINVFNQTEYKISNVEEFIHTYSSYKKKNVNKNIQILFFMTNRKTKKRKHLAVQVFSSSKAEDIWHMDLSS